VKERCQPVLGNNLAVEDQSFSVFVVLLSLATLEVITAS